MPKKKFLELRADLFFQVRRFFREREFLEVETPIRIPAPLPEAHIDAVPSGDWFLQTSPESCMKRLLARGYQNIFQICRVFRQEELGSRHLPEFTMLEWYRAGADYTALMNDCQRLFSHLLEHLDEATPLVFRDRILDMAQPWPCLSVKEAFTKHASTSMEDALASGTFDEIMAFEIEPSLGLNPVFLRDYPIEKAALARPKPGNPNVAERFELYVGGMELANAFSELVDPVEQSARFEQEERERRASGKAPYPPPEKFLSDLGSLPPSAGIALGMDRLAMLFADTLEIGDVSAFLPGDL